jgi:hypothetical protein
MILLLLLLIDEKPRPVPKSIAGVRIVTEINDNFYPDYWKNDKEINAEASPADPREIERVIPLIETFVKDYPEKVLQRNLKSINLCKVLKFYGKPYGGTNSSDAVYLCLESSSQGYTNSYLLASMHHEFSSILMRNYDRKFPKEAWGALNPKSFKYADNAVASLGQDNLLTPSKAAREQGFICKYSKCSMEEDFNTIADYLFSERKRLLEWAKAHPKLQAKVQLAIKFYRSIDVGFNFGELEELLK